MTEDSPILLPIWRDINARLRANCTEVGHAALSWIHVLMSKTMLCTTLHILVASMGVMKFLPWILADAQQLITHQLGQQYLLIFMVYGVS